MARSGDPRYGPLMRLFSYLATLLAALSCLAAVPSQSVRAEYEIEGAACFSKLAAVLNDAGYSHELRLDWSEDGPSIVDETEALAEREGVQVALLWDGERMHAVAPFLTHRRARNLVRYAAGISSSPLDQLCVFARAVQEDAGERAFQRTILGAIAIAAFALGASLLLRMGRANGRSGV